MLIKCDYSKVSFIPLFKYVNLKKISDINFSYDDLKSLIIVSLF